MTERQVELVALACQLVAYRCVLLPLQDCALTRHEWSLRFAREVIAGAHYGL